MRILASAAFTLSLAVTLLAVAFVIVTSADVRTLERENEALRQYNAATFSKLDCDIDEVDAGIISKVSHIWGIEPALLASVRIQENGRENRQTGYNGKTRWISENFERKEFQYAETARLISKINARWTMADDKHLRKGYWHFLATNYTGGEDKKIKAWEMNVRKFYKMVKSNSGYAKTRRASKSLSVAGDYGSRE